MYFVFPIIVLLIAVIASIEPNTFLWAVPLIIPLLGVAMFGMGITLSPQDFKAVAKTPKIVLIGIFTQYIVMSGLAYLLVNIFNLPPALGIGLILVGTCPGGVSSNLMTFIAKGDLALSVSMTACSTFLAPILTPLCTLILANKWFHIDALSMFLSIFKIVIIPICLGVLLNQVKSLKLIKKHMPKVSIIAITIIIGAVVSLNADKVLTIPISVICAVILHNILGLIIGFYVGKSFNLKTKQCKTLSIETGLQNSGLAASLAKIHFIAMPEAMLPAVFFAIWHNIAGAILASFWAIKENKQTKAFTTFSENEINLNIKQ